MLQISKPHISFINEEIHTYEQVSEGCAICSESVSILLAKTMFDWLGKQISSKPVEIEKLAQSLEVVESHTDLFTALLLVLKREGYINEKAGLVQKTNFDESSLNEKARNLNDQGLAFYGKGQWLQDAVGPSFELARVCIPRLPELLKGEISGLQLLFSDENYKLSTALYSAHFQEVYYGLIAGQIVEKCHKIWALNPNRQIRILEIGAGSGRGTIRMLEGLREYGNKIHYCFTDIGNSFLRRAKRTFEIFDCEKEFRLLDISKNPEEQGFEKNSFDIAFATNVLHATPDLNVTLSNTCDLLNTGGTVFINEISADLASNTVTFGTTPGWWLHSDGLRMPYSPAATTTTFRQLLPKIGFENIEVIGYPGVPENELPQAIIQGVKK